MKPIEANGDLIAKCGLYCGACPYYLKGRCPGCEKNVKAEKWCKVRTCNLESGTRNCAHCKTETAETCRAYNNPMARFFGFIFRSNRTACIARIREVGESAFAAEMAKKRRASLPR